MASTGAIAPALTDERLEELLKLTAGADSVVDNADVRELAFGRLSQRMANGS